MKMLKAFVRVLFYLLLFVGGVVLGILVQQSFSQFFNAPIETSGVVILERIQALSDLTTTRYSFSNIVTSERELPGILGALYGDRLVMRAVGYVTAGIDMGKVTNQDITSQNGQLTITLPYPALHECILDENASSVVSRDTGIFIKALPTLDKDSRQFALQSFRDMALHNGILDDAKTHAQEVVSNFLTLASPKQPPPTITFAPQDPNAPLPSSCS